MEIFEQVYLRGMHFRGSHAKAYVDTLYEGQHLYLKREPRNKSDFNAIQVWNRPLDETELDTVTGEAIPTGFHFAYVGGESAVWIAPLLDEGKAMIATVTGVDRSGRTPYPVVTISELPESSIANDPDSE